MTIQPHTPPLHPVSAPRSAETVAVALETLAYLTMLPSTTLEGLPENVQAWLEQVRGSPSDGALRLDEARRLRTRGLLYLPTEVERAAGPMLPQESLR